MTFKNNSNYYSNKIDRLDNERDHLDKLSVSNLVSNRDSLSKKVLKSKELQKELKDANRKYNSNFFKLFVFVLASCIFSILSMVNPLCFIGAFLSSLMAGSHMIDENGINIKKEYLRNRINNLDSDFELTQEIIDNIVANNKSKTNTSKAVGEVKAVGETLEVNPELETMVDSYIASLEKNSTDDRPNILIKQIMNNTFSVLFFFTF